MTASLNNRINASQFHLIRLSTSRLIDDSKPRLAVPLAVKIPAATATIAEIIAAKLPRN